MRVRLGRVDSQTQLAPESQVPEQAAQATTGTGSDTFELGGLSVQGLKPDSIESGSLQFAVPLKPGHLSVPALFEDAQVTIPPNATAFFSLEIGKGSDGVLKITKAALDLTHPVVIENPASAFLDPGTSAWSRGTTALRDRLAKIHLEGFEIDSNGSLNLQGCLIKAKIKRCLLSEVIEVPKLSLSLSELFKKFATTKQNGSSLETLQCFGKMFGEAYYTARLSLAPTVLSMRNNSLDFVSERRGAYAQIKGRCSLNEALDFSLTADPQNSFIDSLLGKMTLDASVHVQHPLEENAHLDFSLDGHIDDLPKLNVTGNHVHANSAHFFARGEADLGLKSRSVKNGAAIAGCAIDRPTIQVGNVTAEVSDSIGATLSIRDFTLQNAHKAPSFIGRVSSFLKDERMRQVEVNFRVHKSGRLSASPFDNPVSHLIDLPFGRYPRSTLSNNELPNGLGRLTTAAFQQQIARLTKSRITKDNYAELLVDGDRSFPRRLSLINEAKDSICLQTLVFQDDETGMAIASALARAARRGVKVRVIVDGQGVADKLANIVAHNKAFETMLQAGVDLRIHNDKAINGLREILDIMVDNKLTPYSKEELVKGSIAKLAAVIYDCVLRLQSGRLELSVEQRRKFIAAINHGIGREPNTPIDAANPVIPTNSDGHIRVGPFIDRVQSIIQQVYSWHEKHFIVDGQIGIWGGMNISDPYLTGKWRDTDVLIEGPAVDDGADAFNKNWHHLTGEHLILGRYQPEKRKYSTKEGVSVQIIQHSPSINGDNHITDFLVANLNRLQQGESAFFENAYFCASTTLSPLYDAMINAAKRGVKITVLTNSEVSSDLPAINRAAFHTYRDLMKAGVRIFERKDDRTIHSKIAVLGSGVSIVGSANLDNRSARVNSEVIAVIHDEKFADTQRQVIQNDLDPKFAKEITYADLAAIPPMQSARFVVMSMLRDMC